MDVAGGRWRYNLDALEQEMPKILSFPDTGAAQYSGLTLFLSGGQSDYVRPEHRMTIKEKFPNARFAKIPKAGHWLHADDPRSFQASAAAFLSYQT